ncbi:MAG: hypothetical protein Q9177_006605 [Variospora cf. flavescens]
MSIELKEATGEKENLEQAAKGYESLLEQNHVRDTKSERERFQRKLERAKAQYTDWEKRSQVLQEIVTSAESRVQDVCALETDPNMLPDAFEDDAIEREEELQQISRNAARTKSVDGFLVFDKEDPNCKLSFKDLDRSNIEATPDDLVRQGLGLQLFLKAGRVPQRLPIHAVGDKTGPAIMDYGPALKMFGVPEGPGSNPGQKSEPSAEPSIEDSVEQCSVADAPTALLEPKTERDHRQQGDSPQTTALLSEDQQWALFGSSKFMGDAANLARQYAKLVADKERKEDKKSQKDKQSGESSATDPVVPDSSTDSVTDSERWPAVEQLDWVGFTNWIARCKQADKSFGRVTLKTWRSQRSHRMDELAAKLKEWKAPEGFDDGSSKHPDPKQYYTGQPLAVLDATKLGLIKKPRTPKP